MTKGKSLYIIGLIALSAIGCAGNLKHPGGAVQDDSAAVAPADSLLSDMIDSEQQKDLSEEVSKRVTAMFDDVFRHYAIEDSLIRIEESPLGNKKTDDWDKTSYYSESLKALWDKLPDDDIVIDYDPWTMSQDYDTLVCRKVEVLSVNKDSAVVEVTIFLSKNWPEKKIRLEMTNEKKPASEKADWYIADFQYNGSMAKEISDYLKEFEITN
ncbi:MAG: hypothetical protein IJ533_08885 [Prevotella sp.]|nr:hypothetical protein [Prevotella sp.]